MAYVFRGKLGSEDLKELAKYDFRKEGENSVTYGLVFIVAIITLVSIYYYMGDGTPLVVGAAGLGLLRSIDIYTDLHKRFIKTFDSSEMIENIATLTDDFVSIRSEKYQIEADWSQVLEVNDIDVGVVVQVMNFRFFLANREFRDASEKAEFLVFTTASMNASKGNT